MLLTTAVSPFTCLSSMQNFIVNSELESYLRLNRAACGEWTLALQDLLGCTGLVCDLSRPKAEAGSLSALEVGAGMVAALSVSQNLILKHCCLDSPLLVFRVQGRCEVVSAGKAATTVFPFQVFPPAQTFSLRVAADSRVLLLRLADQPDAPHTGPAIGDAITRCIHGFLFQVGFLQDHDHGCRAAETLLQEINGILRGNTAAASATTAIPEPDRRLLKAIIKIRTEPDWPFDLQDLSSHAGVSERNLYYLMKRQTGMTPYRYYQRCRLIRVRRRLVDCQCAVPHISRYAGDEGFSHFGRFAALYREHFGELPSETVQWRRRLQAQELLAPALS